MNRSSLITILLLAISLASKAQVGSFRNDLAIGFNGGYQLNQISFLPKVPQDMHGGVNGGFTIRYICEKYFNMICGIQLEANYAQMGWKESILSPNDEPCISKKDDTPLSYERTINYFQIPLMAHLGFGRETKGAKFFINLGPQFGFLLNESYKSNFVITDEQGKQQLSGAFNCIPERVSSVVAQDTMAVENKFDYGITAGLGGEFSMGKAGHVLLEARYYYGLGNIYGDSKADYFARSNHSSIIFKATYLFDLMRTRKEK